VKHALDYMKQRVGGCGGMVAVDSKSGQTAHHCTTERMAWASMSHGLVHYGLESSDMDAVTEQWMTDE
jgi:hypothetical protein